MGGPYTIDMSSCPCCGIGTCCCGNAIPTSLTLTYLSNTNFMYPLTTCADYTGLTITLVYGTYAAFSSAPLQRWQGTGTNSIGSGCCVDTITCMFWCGGTYPHCGFGGYMYCGTQTFGETYTAASTTCSPFEIDFECGGAEPGCGHGCPQQRLWKITA